MYHNTTDEWMGRTVVDRESGQPLGRVDRVFLHPRSGKVQSVRTTRVLGYWKKCTVRLILYRTRHGTWCNAFDRRRAYDLV